MITLFSFRIVYLCRIRVINIGVRGVDCEMVIELIYVPWKIGVFIYLLLVCCSIRALVIKVFR
jgi:hypothetical protein